MEAIHEMIFSGGIKKGGTWGGPTCAAHVPYEAHVLEYLLWTVLSVGIYFSLNVPNLLKKYLSKVNAITAGHNQSAFWRQIDFLIAAIHLGMWLQPCHLSLLLNAGAVTFDGLTGLLCSLVGMPLAIGAVMALLFPATEGLDQPYEELSFFIQHWILLVVPVFLVCRKNFSIATIFDFRCLLIANWIVMLVHWVFFVHLDRYFEVNVNFFLCPSEGMVDPFKILPWFALWPSYRTFLSFLMFVCSIPLCYAYVLCGRLARKLIVTEPAKKDE